MTCAKTERRRDVRRIKQLSELPEPPRVQIEKYLIKQHRLRFVAGRFQHKVGAALPEQLCRLIGLFPLFGPCPKIDGRITHEHLLICARKSYIHPGVSFKDWISAPTGGCYCC